MKAGQLRHRVVSTHSRLKAAVLPAASSQQCVAVSTHSRLKAAARSLKSETAREIVSTHSRLKAADGRQQLYALRNRFNTQPPEGGCG